MSYRASEYGALSPYYRNWRWPVMAGTGGRNEKPGLVGLAAAWVVLAGRQANTRRPPYRPYHANKASILKMPQATSLSVLANAELGEETARQGHHGLSRKGRLMMDD
jgi:hypothetical protein